MKTRLPPFPSDTHAAVVQIRRGTRAVTRVIGEFVEASERLTYYRIGKFPSHGRQMQRTAMTRGKLRKHIQRWLERVEELLAYDVSVTLYRAVRRLTLCVEKIFYWSDRIPRKDKWHGDDWCQRMYAVADEIRGLVS